MLKWTVNLSAAAVLGWLGWLGVQSGAVSGLSGSQGSASAAGIAASSVSSDAVYRIGQVETRPITETITAVGSLAPVALVSVSSLVSGQIKELHADFNDDVKQGDPVARIDPITFRIAVDQAEADLDMAKAGLVKAEVEAREAEAEYERKLALAARGSINAVERDRALVLRDLAAARTLEVGAIIRRAEAALHRAQIELDRTVIHAPVDGVVVHRSVEVGQTVTVSMDAPTLFTIAQDLRAMQVKAAVAESEIGRIRLGQRIEFSVDSYPGRVFTGEVIQIRLQPQTVQNVVSYTVVASAPNPDLVLLPGMTANTTIVVEESEPQVAVPSAALRFRPPGEPRSDETRVFVEKEGQLVAIPVEVGVTDGAFTSITSTELAAGDSVVTGLALSNVDSSSRRPFFGLF